jgi:hypothetical protein
MLSIHIVMIYFKSVDQQLSRSANQIAEIINISYVQMLNMFLGLLCIHIYDQTQNITLF